MNSYPKSIPEKRIVIIKKDSFSEKEKEKEKEYDLKQNFFDPSKSSPPNDFMMKLQMRMCYYDSLNKFDNLIRE
jgi:hypothetical protein